MSEMTVFHNPGVPPSPGEVIREKIIEGMGVTQARLARALGISAPRLNMILSGHCLLSPEIALRLGHTTGISPQFWLKVRADFELWEEKRRLSNIIGSLPRLENLREDQRTPWPVEEWKVAA